MESGARHIAMIAGVPKEGRLFRFRAAAGSSHRVPKRCYGLVLAWLSTSTEHAASLDSAYPQPDGEHIVKLPPD